MIFRKSVMRIVCQLTKKHYLCIGIVTGISGRRDDNPLKETWCEPQKSLPRRLLFFVFSGNTILDIFTRSLLFSNHEHGGFLPHDQHFRIRFLVLVVSFWRHSFHQCGLGEDVSQPENFSRRFIWHWSKNWSKTKMICKKDWKVLFCCLTYSCC